MRTWTRSARILARAPQVDSRTSVLDQQPIVPHTEDRAVETMVTKRSRATPQIATTKALVIKTIKTQPGTSPRSVPQRAANQLKMRRNMVPPASQRPAA